MLSEHAFESNGRTYTVRFTSRARLLFERAIGYPMSDLRAIRGTDSEVEFVHLIWAGLEGQRAIDKSRAKPWTVDEVSDQIIGLLSLEERQPLFRALLEAWREAFLPAREEDAKGAEGKAPQPTS